MVPLSELLPRKCIPVQKDESVSDVFCLQAPSICAAAKADTEQLSSILTLHACSASPTPAATIQEPSSSPAVESAIASLTHRIAALESELASAHAELRDAQALRGRSRKGKGATGARASQADNVFAAKHAAQRLESIVMEVARLPTGEAAKNGTHTAGGNSAATDSTLMQLLDFSTHTAQMQDKLMDKLAEQLEFARARLVSASNMHSDSGIANARKLFSNVRAASSETHDSAARLEALVASLESAISSSPSFSTLRPMAMQVWGCEAVVCTVFISVRLLHVALTDKHVAVLSLHAVGMLSPTRMYVCLI